MKDFRNSVVYQIYPKSFLDTNGDGLGDLKGVTAKLDYLEKLGVDYIWLTPFFVSPQNDNGYDVADYRAIDPRYGTMADFEELVAQAEAHNIRIMLDMVFNHTSTYHQWFQKALAGDPVYQDYYIFRPGKPDGTPPTNWESKFGGNAQAQVEDKDSIFAHYQALIRLRHTYDVFAQGDFTPLTPDHPAVLAYQHKYQGQELICVSNFYRKECVWKAPVALDGYQVLLSNYSDSEPKAQWTLRPYESVLLLKESR